MGSISIIFFITYSILHISDTCSPCESNNNQSSRSPRLPQLYHARLRWECCLLYNRAVEGFISSGSIFENPLCTQWCIQSPVKMDFGACRMGQEVVHLSRGQTPPFICVLLLGSYDWFIFLFYVKHLQFRCKYGLRCVHEQRKKQSALMSLWPSHKTTSHSVIVGLIRWCTDYHMLCTHTHVCTVFF